ncbi:MAG: hypothetical protein SVX38_09890 [Chloroflexota bacterium]|nr:hypothetical protein [Chloroflexota bacterium]
MQVAYKTFPLMLLFAFITACTTATANTPVPTATAVQWDISPTALVIRSYTGPAIGVTYDPNYYVPEAQVWGDGRIIWVEDAQAYPRRVLIGHLTTDQMESLLQRIADTGFFDWANGYGIGGSTHQPWHLSVNVSGHTKEVIAYDDTAPDAYFELIDFLSHGAGATGSDFEPRRGYLTARCWPIEEVTPSAQWADATAGFTLDQVGDGRYIEGQALSFAWQTINQYPTAPVYVKSNGQTCVIMVQIPGVSFYEPPP